MSVEIGDLPGNIPGNIPSAVREDSPPPVDLSWVHRPWPPVFRGKPPTKHEKSIWGEACERCEETGFIFDVGSGALSKAEQTTMFKRNLLTPDWVVGYFRSDPHGQGRHPKLYQQYRHILEKKQ